MTASSKRWGSYTMQQEKIVAKSWVEFLEKDLEAAQDWLKTQTT